MQIIEGSVWKPEAVLVKNYPQSASTMQKYFQGSVLEKGVFKNVGKVLEKHLFQSLFFNNVEGWS